MTRIFLNPASWAVPGIAGRPTGPVLSCQPPCHGACRPILLAKYPPHSPSGGRRGVPRIPYHPEVRKILRFEQVKIVPPPPRRRAGRSRSRPAASAGFPALLGTGAIRRDARRACRRRLRSSGVAGRPDVYGVGTYAHDAVGTSTPFRTAVLLCIDRPKACEKQNVVRTAK